VIAGLGVLAACSPQAPAQNASANVSIEESAQTGLGQMGIVIHSRTGDHRFMVEIATTPEQQERGLMFRRSLGPDQGMIFPYDPAQRVSFWMRNTLIPLDIIFIRPDRTIARITNAKALDETPLPSGEPVDGVLEIGGGRAAELGIQPGDVVDWLDRQPCCKP
jgi:uncharacterized membrane protein (UPF0127 family)